MGRQRYLTFTLYGAMASWGEVAVGQERSSGVHPSRSAVLGLLAAALGLERGDPRQRELFENFGVATLVEAGGIPIRDFHTSQVPSSSALKGLNPSTRRDELLSGGLSTILSSREYLCDSVCRVAIWSRGETQWSLDELAQALVTPMFPLYLGRKSCPPALPLQPQLLESESMVRCFEDSEDGSLKWADVKGLHDCDQDYCWDEDLVQPGLDYQMIKQRRDQPTDRMKWYFENRTVLHARAPRADEVKEA